MLPKSDLVILFYCCHHSLGKNNFFIRNFVNMWIRWDPSNYKESTEEKKQTKLKLSIIQLNFFLPRSDFHNNRWEKFIGTINGIDVCNKLLGN